MQIAREVTTACRLGVEVCDIISDSTTVSSRFRL